jgi:hypothetical protein
VPRSRIARANAREHRKVVRQRGVPELQLLLEDGRRPVRAEVAHVVDAHVQPAELLEHLRHHALDRVGARDIGLDRKPGGTQPAQLLGDALRALQLQVHHRHARARARELPRDAAAAALAGARDHHRLALQAQHGVRHRSARAQMCRSSRRASSRGRDTMAL